MNISFSILLVILFSFGNHSIAYSMVSTEGNDYEHRKATIEMTDTNEELLHRLNDEELAWYDKFQEGMMFFSGWKEISEEILTSLPADKRPHTKKILKTLGVRIGSEWSKDNSIRKIDTDMLRTWGSQLRKSKKQGAEKILRKLKEISAEVEQILAENSPNNLENSNST